MAVEDLSKFSTGIEPALAIQSARQTQEGVLNLLRRSVNKKMTSREPRLYVSSADPPTITLAAWWPFIRSVLNEYGTVTRAAALHKRYRKGEDHIGIAVALQERLTRWNASIEDVHCDVERHYCLLVDPIEVGMLTGVLEIVQSQVIRTHPKSLLASYNDACCHNTVPEKQTAVEKYKEEARQHYAPWCVVEITYDSAYEALLGLTHLSNQLGVEPVEHEDF